MASIQIGFTDIDPIYQLLLSIPHKLWSLNIDYSFIIFDTIIKINFQMFFDNIPTMMAKQNLVEYIA